MSLIIIIRHGYSESNQKNYITHDIEGYPLTEEGKKDIIKSAEELKKIKNLDEIISSPIIRARQTAEIISRATGLKIKIDKRLTERQTGRYNNKPIPKEERDWRLKEALNNDPNGLENWTSIEKRSESLLNEIPVEKNVILVSHGDVIKAIIGYYLGMNEFEVWGIKIDHGCFTVIDTKERKLLAVGSPIISDSTIKKIEKAENNRDI